MKIYLAGPMSGLPDDNYPAFHAAAARLREQRHEVFSPAEIEPDEHGREWTYFIKRGIRALLDCERVVLLPGWESSRGARVEYQIAMELGMQVDHYVEPTQLKPRGETVS